MVSVSVHPRACGEPQTRAAVDRFIPAPAGNSQYFHDRFIPAPAGNSPPRSSLAFGSSPRLRGTGSRFIPAPAGNSFQAEYFRRFIPAPAGNRPDNRASRTSNRFIPAPAGNRCNSSVRTVHPRACGEQNSIVRQRLLIVRLRFIPAPAGNRESTRIRGAVVFLCGSSVHPRACGEQERQQTLCRLPAPAAEFQVDGFIPAPAGNRARSQAVTGNIPRLPRFIPAPAGNSVNTVPRACGEQFQQAAGSSPRLRGTGSLAASYPVHPRACGEQYAGSFDVGSSPRLRGTGKHS